MVAVFPVPENALLGEIQFSDRNEILRLPVSLPLRPGDYEMRAGSY